MNCYKIKINYLGSILKLSIDGQKTKYRNCKYIFFRDFMKVKEYFLWVNKQNFSLSTFNLWRWWEMSLTPTFTVYTTYTFFFDDLFGKLSSLLNIIAQNKKRKGNFPADFKCTVIECSILRTNPQERAKVKNIICSDEKSLYSKSGILTFILFL